MGDDLLDTNVFIHALLNDSHSEECRAFLGLVRDGHVQARLDPLVIHELTYSLPKTVKQMGRSDVANYLLGILSWNGVICDKVLLSETLDRWDRTPGLGFVDANLAAQAAREDVAVYSKNVREFVRQRVRVANPLPTRR